MMHGMCLRHRMILYVTVLAVLILLLCMVISASVTRSEVKKIAFETICTALRANQQKLSSSLGQMSSQIVTLANSAELTKGLSDYQQQEILEKWKRWREMDGLLTTWASFSPYTNVRLYMPESMVLLRDCFRFFPNAEAVLSGVPYSTSFGTQYWHVNQEEVSCFMPVMKNFRTLAYVELCMSISWFQSDEGGAHSVNQFTVLTDEAGGVLSDGDAGVLSIDLEQAVDCSSADLETILKISREAPLLYLYCPVDHTPFFVVTALDQGVLQQSSQKIIKQLLVFSIPLLILAVLLACYITARLTGKIRLLSEKIDQIKQGNFEISAPPTSRDELDQALHEFAQMASQLTLYLDKIKRSEQLQKESELQLLQNQINPHFIANALASVDAMARQNRPDQVHRMIKAICNYLRLSFSKSWQVTTVEKELELVRTYWQIEQYCFNTQLCLSIHASPNLLALYIPPLIIQTLVENSILHGKRAEGPHSVDIRLSESDGVLVIEVEDNGFGMSDERLRQVRRAILSDQVSDCYGLWNVNRRICERYGQDYGLAVKSEWNVGTLCILTLPAGLRSDGSAPPENSNGGKQP